MGFDNHERSTMQRARRVSTPKTADTLHGSAGASRTAFVVLSVGLELRCGAGRACAIEENTPENWHCPRHYISYYHFLMPLSDNRITPSQKSRFARLLCVTSFIVAHSFLHADTENDFAISTSPFVTEGFAQLEAGQPENALIAFHIQPALHRLAHSTWTHRGRCRSLLRLRGHHAPTSLPRLTQ